MKLVYEAFDLSKFDYNKENIKSIIETKMTYFTIIPLYIAMQRARTGLEHGSLTVGDKLLNHYFSQLFPNTYIVSPQQQQTLSGKIPDFVVERVHNNNNDLIPHVFMEAKSTSGDSIGQAVDQVIETALENIAELHPDCSVFVIIIKGVKIAFFEYHSYASLLDENDIYNYEGFIPLTYQMSFEQFRSINGDVSMAEYFNYVQHFRQNLPFEVDDLKAMGIGSGRKITHPHILDLLNARHKNYIHTLFQTMGVNESGSYIRDHTV